MPLTPKEQEVAELLLDKALQRLKDEKIEHHYFSRIESYKSLMEGARNRTDMQMAEWAVEQQKLQMQLQAQAIKEKFSQQPKGPVSYGG